MPSLIALRNKEIQLRLLNRARIKNEKLVLAGNKYRLAVAVSVNIRYFSTLSA
jgi:hypothetical protein